MRPRTPKNGGRLEGDSSLSSKERANKEGCCERREEEDPTVWWNLMMKKERNCNFFLVA